MNHKEELLTLNKDELRKIINRLNLSYFHDSASSWMASQIANFYQGAKNLQSIIPQTGKQTIDDLMLHAHTEKPLNEQQKKILSEYGVFIESELPDDFKDRLRQWTRSNYVKEFPTRREDVQHSFFLKFLFVLIYFQKVDRVKLTRRKNDRNVRLISEELFMTKETIWYMVNYLVSSGFVKKSKDLFVLNHEFYNQWRKKPIDNVLENFYVHDAGDKALQFLRRISLYQMDQFEWVDMVVLTGTSTEFDKARQRGLVHVHNENGNTYVQLTPESWYMTKKQFHPLWNEKLILVSAAFEVFVPYHYEPFILFELLPFCILKDSHYFLVFDIDLDFQNNSKPRTFFYNTLAAKSNHIPDVVKYELETR